MLHLCGCPVPREDASWLVGRLYQDDHAGPVHAALVIESALRHGAVAVELSLDDRRAILGVLDDPPDGLAELRAALMREGFGYRGG